MRRRIEIRPALADDFAGIAALIEELGYSVRPEALAVVLRRVCGSAHGRVLVAVTEGGVAGLLVISCAPSGRAQRRSGGTESLVVRIAFRSRELGDILLQYAKAVAMTHDTRPRTGTDFVLCRSFESVDEVTYRWGTTDGPQRSVTFT